MAKIKTTDISHISYVEDYMEQLKCSSINNTIKKIKSHYISTMKAYSAIKIKKLQLFAKM